MTFSNGIKAVKSNSANKKVKALAVMFEEIICNPPPGFTHHSRLTVSDGAHFTIDAGEF